MIRAGIEFGSEKSIGEAAGDWDWRRLLAEVVVENCLFLFRSWGCFVAGMRRLRERRETEGCWRMEKEECN